MDKHVPFRQTDKYSFISAYVQVLIEYSLGPRNNFNKPADTQGRLTGKKTQAISKASRKQLILAHGRGSSVINICSCLQRVDGSINWQDELTGRNWKRFRRGEVSVPSKDFVLFFSFFLLRFVFFFLSIFLFCFEFVLIIIYFFFTDLLICFIYLFIHTFVYLCAHLLILFFICLSVYLSNYQYLFIFASIYLLIY